MLNPRYVCGVRGISGTDHTVQLDAFEWIQIAGEQSLAHACYLGGILRVHVSVNVPQPNAIEFQALHTLILVYPSLPPLSDTCLFRTKCITHCRLNTHTMCPLPATCPVSLTHAYTYLHHVPYTEGVPGFEAVVSRCIQQIVLSTTTSSGRVPRTTDKSR